MCQLVWTRGKCGCYSAGTKVLVQCKYFIQLQPSVDLSFFTKKGKKKSETNQKVNCVYKGVMFKLV